MDRYMLHLKNTSYVPSDASSLLRKARDLSKDLDVTVRDCRVASKLLEFDVSVDQNTLDKLVESLSSLAELDHAKHVIEEEIQKEAAIEDGIFYFNNERFWECHEVLEGVWKKCYEGEKDTVQGIILVAAALVHYQKNENEICISIFDRALKKLSNSTGIYHKIDVDKLRKQVMEIQSSGKISTFVI